MAVWQVGEGGGGWRRLRRWAGWGAWVSHQPGEGLVFRAIIRKRLCDFWVQDDDVSRLGDSVGILATHERSKVGTLVFAPQPVGRLAASLLHRSPSRCGSLRVR